jgi:hypothetical protein
MDQEKKQQSIEVFGKARADVVANGKISRPALRAMLHGLTEFQFAMAWCSFRRALRAETGYRLKPVPKSGGIYRLDTAEEGSRSALESDRLKVVNAARNHLQALVDVQRREDLTDDTRQFVSREEVIRSRDTVAVERAYLRTQRRRPAGCEESKG